MTQPSTGSTPPARPAARPGPPTRYTAPLWFVRVAVAGHLALLVWEFVTGGRLVALDFEYLSPHSVGAVVLHVAAGAQLVAAVLVWRPGGGPLLPAVLSLAAFVVGFGQARLGSANVMELHVPVALLLSALVVWAAVLVWSPSAGRGRG